MDEYVQVITIFVAGLFGLLVAVVTALLANVKDTRTYRRDRDRSRYEDTKSLYVDSIATLEKCIRRTQRLEDYSELIDELPRLNATLQLASPKEIVDQSEIVSAIIYQWSSEYRRGAPKTIGDTGMAMISSHDSPHQEQAKTLYPKLIEEIVKLARLMKDHLRAIEM